MRTVLSLLALALLALPAPAADAVDIRTEKKGEITFVVGDEVVARYHIDESVAKPYAWPVLAPGGVPVTRAWPMAEAGPNGTKDHVHQKSLWFCHGDVIPEGVELKHKIRGVEGVDFWSEAPGHGKIVCTNVSRTSGGKDSQSIQTLNEWRTADGTKILDETRLLTLRPLGEKGWLLVFDIDLHASVCPITFGDTKEGSMGVRVNDQIREKGGNGVMTNAQGETGAKALWGQKSDWIDYSGTIDGKPAGIAVFDDPENKYRAAWHARDYGLLAANPFGRARSGFPAQKGNTDLVKLDKGEHLKLRYGVYVHTGDVQSGGVKEAFEAFRKK